MTGRVPSSRFSRYKWVHLRQSRDQGRRRPLPPYPYRGAAPRGGSGRSSTREAPIPGSALPVESPTTGMAHPTATTGRTAPPSDPRGGSDHVSLILEQPVRGIHQFAIEGGILARGGCQVSHP
jgi:hypothetical protein